jgi:hypothetical protein
MCDPLALTSGILLLVFGCSIPFSITLQGRFLAQLEEQQPVLWKQLGSRKVFFKNDDGAYTARQKYLLSGEFKNLSDSSLVTLGKRAQHAYFRSCAIFTLWGLFVTITQASPSFSCLY